MPTSTIPQQARHILRTLMPPWLRRPVGDSFCAEGLFTIYDLDAEAMRDSLLARFPSYAPEDALPLLARDRGIPIGPAEAPDVVRERLKLWLDLLALAGLPMGLLLAMQAVMGPGYARVRLVTQGSLWHTLAAGAVGRWLALAGYVPLPPAPYELGAAWPARSPPAPLSERLRYSGLLARLQASPENWDWDSLTPSPGTGTRWSAWVVVDATAGDVFLEEGAWGSPGDWGDGGYWGVEPATGSAVGVGPTLQATAERFKSAQAWIRGIIVAFDNTLFDPAAAPGDPVNPDGRFGRWGKSSGGARVPARFEAARYAGGTA